MYEPIQTNYFNGIKKEEDIPPKKDDVPVPVDDDYGYQKPKKKEERNKNKRRIPWEAPESERPPMQCSIDNLLN